MTRKATFGAIDAGVVLAGLSVLSQVMKRGREGYRSLEGRSLDGYHTLEKRGREGLRALEKRGLEGYHALEKRGREGYEALEQFAPPSWSLPLIGIGAAAVTIAAINPDRIVTRAIKWMKQSLGLSSPPPKRRKVAAKRSRSPARKARAKSTNARAKMNHVAGKRRRTAPSEIRH